MWYGAGKYLAVVQLPTEVCTQLLMNWTEFTQSARLVNGRACFLGFHRRAGGAQLASPARIVQTSESCPRVMRETAQHWPACGLFSIILSPRHTAGKILSPKDLPTGTKISWQCTSAKMDQGSTPAQRAAGSKSALSTPTTSKHDLSDTNSTLQAARPPSVHIAASPAVAAQFQVRRELDTLLAPSAGQGSKVPPAPDLAHERGHAGENKRPSDETGDLTFAASRGTSRSSTETLSDADDAASAGGVSFDDETPSLPRESPAPAPSYSLHASEPFDRHDTTGSDLDELELAAATIDQLQSALQQSNLRCDQLAAGLAAMEESAEASARKLARASAKNKELSGAVKTLRSRLRDSKALTDALRAKQEGGQAQGARTEAALAEMQRRVATERTAAEDAQQALHSTRQQLQERSQQVADAQQAAAAARAAASAAQAEQQAAAQAATEATAQADAANARCRELQQRVHAAAQQEASMRNTMEEQGRQLEALRDDVALLRADIAAEHSKVAAAESAAAAEQAQHAVTRRALRAAENCAMSAEDAAATWPARTERLMRAYSGAAVASEQVQEQLHQVVQERDATIAKLRKQVQRLPQLAEAATQAKRREAVTSGKLLEASTSAQGWYDEAQKAQAALRKAQARNKRLEAELQEHADDEAAWARNSASALAAAASREEAAVVGASDLKAKLQALQGTHKNTVDNLRSLRAELEHTKGQLAAAEDAAAAGEKRITALQSALIGMRLASSKAVAAAGAIAAGAREGGGRSPGSTRTPGQWEHAQLPPGTSPADVLQLLSAMTAEMQAICQQRGAPGSATAGSPAWNGVSSAPLSPVALGDTVASHSRGMGGSGDMARSLRSTMSSEGVPEGGSS